MYVKLLDVVSDSKINFCDHVDNLVKGCNWIYLLIQIFKQGLPADCLQNVFDLIVVSKVL
jgi:hypothetical protein